MSATSRYVEIAVSGPLKKTFVYALPHFIEQLKPGQRVWIPFGRSKKIGYYLRETKPPQGITIKEVIQTLDEESLIPGELFKLCQWIAGYYFANPADVLELCIPAPLRKKNKINYIWAGDAYEKTLSEVKLKLPDAISALIKPNKKISRKSILDIKKIKRQLLRKLIDAKIILEQFETTNNKAQEKRYRGTNQESWKDFFLKKEYEKEFFDSLKSRKDLLLEGWSDYTIKKAVDEDLLKVEYISRTSEILSFISARENLSEIKLTKEQNYVLAELKKELDNQFQIFLLHGVTGSGKTIVYCQLIKELIAKGKTALILTPEIALAGTALAYFRGLFGDDVTILHSAMNDAEKADSWSGIREGRFKIVIGPRSALFAPLPNLGLVIVDEEHDSSYKQDEPSPRFHGRDSAIMRAKLNNIPVLLGSASPSIESYHNAQTGRYRLLELKSRPKGATLPDVKIIDMKSDRIGGEFSYLSFSLKKEIEKRLEKNEQAILYLNRRGYAPNMKCSKCGHVPSCPNCQVTLTWHSVGQKLSCHYCDYLNRNYKSCENCLGNEFIFQGAGTQKIEERIPTLFKNTKISRLDSDSAKGRQKAFEILNDFANQKSNLLLGTQMVTKGIDFPNVTLVGVISADMSLDLPDFRASEKAFSKLLQVSGRSGRAEKKGEVIIQTYYPENKLIQNASRGEYKSFYEREITTRKELNYPPFSRLVKFLFSSQVEKAVEFSTVSFRNQLFKLLKSNNVTFQIIGPSECPLYFLRNNFRRHFFVKTNQVTKLGKILTEWDDNQPRFDLPANIKIAVDIDPDSMM